MRTVIVGGGIGMVLAMSGLRVTERPWMFIVASFLLNGLSYLNRAWQ